MTSQAPQATTVYVGTFTRMGPHARGEAAGIHILHLDPARGALSHVRTVPDVDSPSFLALHPRRDLLYAVNAVPEHDGRPGGSVSAFAIDPASGDLTYLNRQASHGAGPCHVRVHPSGRWALVANYGGGSIAILPIGEDGRLGPATDTVRHAGSSVVPERQQGPHAHSITLDPAGRFALVADLGLDQILVYRVDWERGKLVPNDPPAVTAHPGAGPRHLAFHPNGRYVYAINEIDSTLTAFAYDAVGGTLRAIETVPTLPPEIPAGGATGGTNSTADVHVHPSGRFVYGSNRGHDSIVMYAIDPDTGRLTHVGNEPTRGQTPRNFAIDGAGAFLFAANQDSDTIVTFRIDQQTGRLTATGQTVEVATPVCITFRGQTP